MTKTNFILMCGGFFMASAVYAGAAAQAPAERSVNDGIYTVEQARRGEVLYREQCATCHGDNLEGSGPMPPLAGSDFLNLWEGKSLADLFEKTQSTMPATAPGVLTPAETADLTAYMLMMGQYPAGTTELEATVETLAAVKLQKPAESAAPVGAQ